MSDGYISNLSPDGWHEGGRTCSEQHPSDNLQWCTDCLRAALAAAERERDEARATVKRYEDAFPAGQLIYDALRKDRDDWQRKAERLETLMAHIGTGAGMACRLAMNGKQEEKK